MALKRLALAAALLAVLGAARPARADAVADEAIAAWRHALPSLLIDEPDLVLSTAPAVPLPQTIPAVELFFSTPLAMPARASAWADTVEQAEGLGSLFVLGDDLLGRSAAVEPAAMDWEPPVSLPPSARDAVRRLVAAMAAARPYLDRAVASVSPEDRAGLAALFDWPAPGQPLTEDISSRRQRARLDAMKTFRDADMRTAGGLVLMAVDEALADVADTSFYVPKPLRFESPVGDIVIGGNGPDIYTRQDIENAAIIIDFGGRDTYVGAAACAGPGEMRVVIDLGTSVEVRDDRHPGAAGASFFGVAALAMPNDVGVKRLTTNDWSQGATLGGVAACLICGRAELSAGRYAQGAGVYGIGVLTAVKAAGSTYRCAGDGQGLGGVRGVGVFRHVGDGANLYGGLSEPDPREPGGAESLCQGVGVGPRAFAGGGVGLCVLDGNNVSALASYFAQGAGYWHAAGVFRLRGAGGTVQGRRYALGAGVHEAFGHCEILGNGARVYNWGVGPAYGWDHGAGSAILVGDDMEAQSDWGAGAAGVGGRSFGYYAGRGGRLKLINLGEGNFFRNDAAYTVQVASGTSRSIEGFGEVGGVEGARAMKNAWGVVDISSAALVADLHLSSPTWPSVERAAALEKQTVDLRAALAATEALTSSGTVVALADVAGAFSLDKATPRAALERLLSLPAEQARFLVDAFDPDAVDASIPLAIAIAARGSALTGDLYKVKAPARAPACTGLLRFSRPSTALPLLVTRAGGKNPLWAASAARAIGALMNADTGEEPGERAVLAAVRDALKTGARGDRAVSLLRRIRFNEAMALLATSASIGPGERNELLSAGPEDLTDRLGAPGAGTFLDIVRRNPRDNGERIRKEIAAIDRARPAMRRLMERLSKSRDPLLSRSAVIAAGQIGDARNAAWIEPLLTSKRGDLRQAAAVAFGRMGEAGLPALRRACRSSAPRTRALAAFAAGHATSGGDRSILEASLSDASPVVVTMAVAVLRNLPEALYSARDGLKKKAARRLTETSSRDLKLALKLLP